jgi:RimJ/RimL family protein N-acetyltransferase
MNLASALQSNPQAHLLADACLSFLRRDAAGEFLFHRLEVLWSRMATVYARIPTEHGTLIVRRYAPQDIAIHSAYLHDSPREFLESIGFDTAKIPPKADWIRAITARLEEAQKTGEPPNLIIGELGGKAIGAVFYDTRDVKDPTPRLHFHIFDPELRGKGLGGILFTAAVTELRQIYGHERFLIEPRQDNQRMNRLMRKLGYRHIRDYELPAGAVTQAMLVSQYEILVGGVGLPAAPTPDHERL